MSLYCVILIHPLPDPFPVDIFPKNRISENETISKEKLTFGHLKQMILRVIEKSPNVYKSIREVKSLWKVEELAKDNDKWKILEETAKELSDETDIEQKLQELGGEKPTSTKKVKDVFPDPDDDRVHIIVQLFKPATTDKRKTENLDEGNANKKYKEDIETLENEAIKHKISTFINSLNSIDTNQQVFNMPPLPGEVDKTVLYNRKCYNYYRKLILNSKSHNRFLITGNPGIGKTYFGRLMLVELLKSGKKVLFDCKNYTLYINPDGNTYRVNSDEYKLFAQGENTWCIIDGRPPQISHDWSAGKFIMVSPPQRDIIKDFDKPRCKTLYMPTWNENELLECWEELYKSKIPKETIKAKFNLCGGIPRWIFDNEMSHEKICKIIVSASKSIDSCIIDYKAKLFFGHEFSHKIIQIHTNPEETENPYTDTICLFASKYAASKCPDHLKNHNKERFRTFIESARNIKEMGALREQLFELLSEEDFQHAN